MIIVSINARLGAFFGENIQKFKKLLEDSGGYISGSFIIDCILNKCWKNYFPLLQIFVDVPLDIYVISEECMDIFTSKFHPFFTDLQDEIGDAWYYVSCTDDIFDDYYNLHINQSVIVRGFERANDKEWVKSIMNFDVCRNIYYIENGVEKIEIANLRGILDMVIRCSQEEYLLYSERMVEKYVERGFRFDVMERKIEISNAS